MSEFRPKGGTTEIAINRISSNRSSQKSGTLNSRKRGRLDSLTVRERCGRCTRTVRCGQIADELIQEHFRPLDETPRRRAAAPDCSSRQQRSGGDNDETKSLDWESPRRFRKAHKWHRAKVAVQRATKSRNTSLSFYVHTVIAKRDQRERQRSEYSSRMQFTDG